MASRSKAALPLPGDELLRMKEYLSPHYGSQVWQDGERRVLVLRVPGEDPDLVNDVERSVEHLAPGDVHDLEGVLMVGSRNTVMMSVHPFRDLMQARIANDREQCAQTRARMGRLGHLLYRAQDDPRRLWRLAIRIRKPRVGELDDVELERIADELGPHLAKPGYAEVQVVYLIADQDDVRIEAALFLQDLQDRHQDEARALRRLEEEKARLEAERQAKEAERARILTEMERRFKPRIATAPLARLGGAIWEAEPGAEARVAGRAANHAPGRTVPGGGALDSERRRMYETLDSLPIPAARSALPGSKGPYLGAQPNDGTSVEPAAVGASGAYHAPLETLPGLATDGLSTSDPGAVQGQGASGDAVPSDPILARLQEELQSAGFSVLLQPKVPGHTVHIAAERAEGYPRRLVCRSEPMVTMDVAEEALQAARDLGVDLVLLVAPEAETEARRRLIATKVKHLLPEQLDNLAL